MVRAPHTVSTRPAFTVTLLMSHQNFRDFQSLFMKRRLKGVDDLGIEIRASAF